MRQTEETRVDGKKHLLCYIAVSYTHLDVYKRQLQDLDAGRHTEIDMFSGALIRMGRELGIPTPYNEYTYHMIKALEEKNDGLFDYTATDAVTCSR